MAFGAHNRFHLMGIEVSKWETIGNEESGLLQIIAREIENGKHVQESCVSSKRGFFGGPRERGIKIGSKKQISDYMGNLGGGEAKSASVDSTYPGASMWRMYS